MRDIRSFGRPSFPKMPDSLRKDLDKISPSHDRSLTYWPCAARLKNGTVLECVFVVAEAPYIQLWGVYPQHDRAKSYVSLADVDALVDSPHRLPAHFANKLYLSGESGMGYALFTVVFSDNSRQAYITGGAVDFIPYPGDKGPHDVVDVIPHEGRNQHPIRNPKYYWCLFSG